MRKIISILSFLGFLFFTVQLPINYFDPRGIELAQITILLGVVGFLGLISVILFFKRFRFGKFFLILLLAVYSFIFIYQGFHTYEKEDFFGSIASIVAYFIGVVFLILALLTVFGTREVNNDQNVRTSPFSK